MKLEEVLPAMREGRYAYDWMGMAWRISSDGSIVYVDELTGEEVHSSPPVDNLTLERKVEWPKGSLGWAINKITENTHICGSVRRRDGRFFDSKPMTYEDALALDWDVL